ncbi:hypothetical protein GUJ93_ZPchr0007g4374 [Zizania palustris]|uniref:Uncharacterized protein n=1 Tax=Zizania palustris TaxID=103762 RepID=A0A8J5SQB3_ZIZPA|nr:hypothetical protein GUJ93_ZPchr0007g4374 [Zizania palustris]
MAMRHAVREDRREPFLAPSGRTARFRAAPMFGSTQIRVGTANFPKPFLFEPPPIWEQVSDAARRREPRARKRNKEKEIVFPPRERPEWRNLFGNWKRRRPG